MNAIPTLDLDRGRIMTESAAMVIYFVDRYPEAGSGPPPTVPPDAAPREGIESRSFAFF